MRKPFDKTTVFMAMARTLAELSKDPNTQVGAVLVGRRGQGVLGCGYNGPPHTVDDTIVPWADRPLKRKWVLHAEANAVLCAIQHGSILGSTMYTVAKPCSGCMVLMARFDLVRVVYGATDPGMCDVEDWDETQKIARAAGIALIPYVMRT